MIETTHNLGRLLDHRFLVFARRHCRSAKRRNISRLRYRIGEEAHGNASFKTAHTDFGLHRRVALQTAHRHQILEIKRELAQFGNLALHEKGHFLRIESASQIVKRHFDHILTHLFGVIGIVGQGLRVGDEDKHLTIIAGVLQFDAATERTDKMTDMKTTGGTVAGENNLIGRHVIAD